LESDGAGDRSSGRGRGVMESIRWRWDVIFKLMENHIARTNQGAAMPVILLMLVLAPDILRC